MNNLLSFLSNNKSNILIGFGLGNLLMGTVLGVAYAPSAKEALDNKKKELNVDKLKPLDVIKTAGPYMIPCISASVVGTGCVLAGNHINVKNTSTAMAAYALSESTLREYREKTKEIVGEKKEKDIREAIAKDELNKHPVSNREIIITGKGDSLCYDSLSDRYFRSNIDTLKKIELRLNRRMLDEHFISLNELYLEMGLNPVELGDDLGWHIDKSYINMKFSSHLTSDGDAAIVIDYDVAPKHFT